MLDLGSFIKLLSISALCKTKKFEHTFPEEFMRLTTSGQFFEGFFGLTTNIVHSLGFL